MKAIPKGMVFFVNCSMKVLSLILLFVPLLSYASEEADKEPTSKKETAETVSVNKTGDGKMIIEGIYKGKNLFVQNPFIDPEEEYGFCITSIPVVNGRKSTRLVKSSAFEIDLSYLKEGDSVYIEINHRSDCTPKILNLEAIDGVVK